MDYNPFVKREDIDKAERLQRKKKRKKKYVKHEIPEDEKGFDIPKIYNRRRWNRGFKSVMKEYDSEFKPCMSFVIYARSI